jgi:hypothetical protein
MKISQALNTNQVNSQNVEYGARLVSDQSTEYMYLLAGVTDWDVSLSKDSDATTYSGAWNGSNSSITTNVTTRGDYTVSGTYRMLMSVEAQDMLFQAFIHDLPLQLLEIHTDVEADGATIKDDEGEIVPAGRFLDWYYEGRLTSWEKSQSVDDGYVEVSFEMAIDGDPQRSWVQVDPTSVEVSTQYPNKGVAPYNTTDYGKASQHEDRNGWVDDNGSGQQMTAA